MSTYRADLEYCRLLHDLLDHGDHVHTRNGDVRRLTVRRVAFTSTPLVSVRRTAWKNSLREMEWFLSGSSNINDLHPSVRHWWMPWADPGGEIAFNYSKQFRRFGSDAARAADSIGLLLGGIREHPYSRRNVITTWNTAEMYSADCPLTNCHGSYVQCFVNPDDTLDLWMCQRSVDVVCGLPHNWVQYWALLLWLARHGGRKAGRFVWDGGDVHLYRQHDDLARRITAAYPEVKRDGPLELAYAPTSADFKADDFSLTGEYTPVLADRAEMIV